MREYTNLFKLICEKLALNMNSKSFDENINIKSLYESSKSLRVKSNTKLKLKRNINMKNMTKLLNYYNF